MLRPVRSCRSAAPRGFGRLRLALVNVLVRAAWLVWNVADKLRGRRRA